MPVGLLALLLVCAAGFAPQDAPAADAAQNAATAAAVTDDEGGDSETRPGGPYYAWVLAPPIVTIVLAIVLRQVIPALVIGLYVAACMLAGATGGWQGGWCLVGGLTQAVEGMLVPAIGDKDHVKIILFTLTIGGMVGVVEGSGGTAAIVRAIRGWASTRARGQVATWFAGLVVFFDDYANAMIVGPSMRPVCDRLRISRAKLAYIVDSTSAPVSSIALIGTWIGTEVGFIHDGLTKLREVPAFLGVDELNRGAAYGVFLSSIPHRVYPILAMLMVLLVGWMNRDFGPMAAAEREAASRAAADERDESSRARRGAAWYALVPVLVLVCGTMGLLGWTGWQAAASAAERFTGMELVWQILTNGDSFNSILYGALASIIVAVAISLLTRAQTLAQTMDSATSTMSRMLPTMIVLVLAWSLSAAMQSLEFGEVARHMLQKAAFDAAWLPLATFITACVVSFATGTSWGTMGILCPAAVTIAAGLLCDAPPDRALPLFYASVGGVLAGAVFGDHCSPISDTTVLSSLACSCSLETHVWTQMPYALVVAIVSVACGNVLCHALGAPIWVGLLLGALVLVLLVRFIGSRPA